MSEFESNYANVPICPDCGEEILCHCGDDHAAHDGIAEDGCSPPLGHTFSPWLHERRCVSENDEDKSGAFRS